MAQLTQLKITQVPIADLKPAEYNPRTITKDEFEGLKASLEIFDFVEPIVVNRDMTIIGGHQRYEVARKLGYKIIPANVLDLDKKAEKKLNVVLNSHAISGKYDDIKLAEILEQLKLDDDYEKLRLNALEPVDLSDQDVVEDEAPPVADEAISKLGEIYQLGRHRLMCGDATNGEMVNELMDSVIATLMVTDPPYGVNYDPKWRDDVDLQVGKRSVGVVANDDRSDWTEAYELFGGDVAYVWHASQQTGAVQHQLSALGFDTVASIIWVKPHFQFSRGDYHWQHEPCWYVVRHGKKHNYVGDRKQSTVWQIANNNPFANKNQEEKTGHSTQKPLECMARPIRNNSSPGQAIYDPFGGSGSTLIACEQLDRTCYMMELDPKYCDVIRKRWAKLTHPETWEAEWQSLAPVVNQ